MEQKSTIRDNSISKVTLSCRVTPQQKLLIARRARENGMSSAQYAEAKILMDDDLILRLDFDKIKEQKVHLEREYKKLLKFREEVREYFDESHMNDFYTHYAYEEEFFHEYPDYSLIGY